MEGNCNVYAHSSVWMRPTRPDRYNMRMVYRSCKPSTGTCKEHNVNDTLWWHHIIQRAAITSMHTLMTLHRHMYCWKYSYMKPMTSKWPDQPIVTYDLIRAVIVSAISLHSHLHHSHLLYISHTYNLMSHHYGINLKIFYILSTKTKSYSKPERAK